DLVFLPSLRLPRFIGKGGTIRPSREEEIKGINVYQRSNRERQLIHAAINEATEWLEPLKKAGLTVIFEAPKPIFRAPPFRCVDFFNRLNPDCKYGLVESVENQENYRAPIIEGIKTLAAKYPNVSIWDPLPLLCGREACRAMQGDRPLFFDADHVSPYGNVVLYPSFKQMINSF
ncbi:MAG: SGNH hydrolase domain-containing protein, partial [Gammaproteobacteria bacterium]